MPARRVRKRGVVSKGFQGLSFLAVLGLLLGAVFILTSNQGCMRVISGHQSTRPMQAGPPPSASDTVKQPAAKDISVDKPQETAPEAAPTDKSEADKPADKPQTAATNAAQGSPPEKQPAEPPRMDPTTNMRTASTPYGSKGEISRGSTKSPRIAITFDAGAASEPTDKILKTLSKHGVHCTFFLTGKWIERNPAICRRIVAEGHEIGNHTYSHPSLTRASEREIGKEIERTEELALRVTGASTKPLFRPPFGARDKRVLGSIARLGYRSIYWHVDCWDSVKAGITPEQISKRVLNLTGNGSIVLMHCGSQATADALDGLLTQLKARGYQPVTVGELLGSS